MESGAKSPIVKAVVSIVLVAVGIRLTIDLLRPVFPVLLGIAIAVAIVWLVRGLLDRRDRL